MVFSPVWAPTGKGSVFLWIFNPTRAFLERRKKWDENLADPENVLTFVGKYRGTMTVMMNGYLQACCDALMARVKSPESNRCFVTVLTQEVTA